MSKQTSKQTKRAERKKKSAVVEIGTVDEAVIVRGLGTEGYVEARHLSKEAQLRQWHKNDKSRTKAKRRGRIAREKDLKLVGEGGGGHRRSKQEKDMVRLMMSRRAMPKKTKKVKPPPKKMFSSVAKAKAFDAEIGATVAVQCLIPASQQTTTQEPLSPFAMVVRLMTQSRDFLSMLKDFEWARVAISSRELLYMLRGRTFWVSFAGFQLSSVPENFSVLRLYGLLRAALSNPQLQRELLTTTVKEGDLLNSENSVQLRIHTTGLESLQYWQDQVVAALTVQNWPNVWQVEDLTNALTVFQQRGGKIADLLAHITAPTLPLKLNKVLTAVLLKLIFTTEGYRVGLSADQVVSLLQGGVEMICDVVGLMHNVPLEDLRSGKYVLQKGVKYCSFMTKVVVQSLCSMTWLRISDAFGHLRPLVKTIFKSLYMGAQLVAVIKKLEAKKSPALAGAKQAMLACLLLRGVKFPASAQEFGRFHEQVVVPLRALAKSNPLVLVNGTFLVDEYKTELRGKKVPVPLKRNLPSILSQDGNTLSTWETILKSPLTTVPQILANLRSLVLLGYPVEEIEAFLSERDVDLQLIFSARQILRSTFDNALVSRICASLKRAKVGVVDGEHPDGWVPSKPTARSCPGFFFVILGERTFKDRQGKTTSLMVSRRVVHSFSDLTVQGYKKCFDRLCEASLEEATSSSLAEAAIVVFNNEMLNSVRVGQPPTVPSYSRAAVWRGEDICVSELSPTPLKRIRAGVTWCEQPGGRRCDLDLSVTLFDRNWEAVDHCDFTQLELKGNCVVHSGDKVTAPYPNGAREAVEINFDKLRGAYPTVAYLVLQVYSFSGVAYEKLFDGSVFVSDPARRGDGPGREAILTAARLTGEGTTNIAGVLYFDESERVHLLNIDQTLDVNTRMAGQGAGIVSSVCRKIFEDRVAARSRRFLDNALLVAATQASRLVLLSQAPAPVELVREPKESSFSFYERAIKAAAKLVPTLTHAVPALEVLKSDVVLRRILLVHGDLISAPKLLQSLPQKLLSCKETRITMINVGEPQSTHTTKVFPFVEATVDVLTGSNVSRLITSCSETAKTY